MADPKRGLYEVLITEALDEQLSRLGGSLRALEAADRIALHLARVVERAIKAIDERERAAIGIDLARRLVDMIRTLPLANELATERPVGLGEVLHGIVGRLPDGRPDAIVEPLIPLLDTTLLTNAARRVAHSEY
ncbi:MAG: helicase [Gammaproteobacteria bacterium]|nr:helicase [Gammaproteobacteria bacterium]